MAGNTYGLEVWGNYQLREWWRLSAGANWLHENLHFEPGSSDIAGIAIAGNDPSYQLSLRSNMRPAANWQLNMELRQIGALPNPASPSYAELDAHIAWTASPSMSLALTGSNLIHPRHLEFGTASAPLQLGATGVETGRSVFLEIRYKASPRT
jgi:iron complex outermembrane recepter protein